MGYQNEQLPTTLPAQFQNRRGSHTAVDYIVGYVLAAVGFNPCAT